MKPCEIALKTPIPSGPVPTDAAYIAETLGFPSAQYFSSTFKLHFNATPAAYRRAHVRG